jgi:hypothetical protein
MNNHGDVWVCVDCLMWHVNADDTGFCQHTDVEFCDDRCNAIREGHGLLRTMYDYIWPVHLAPCENDGYDTFSHDRCEACGSPMAGERHRMAVIGR